MMVIADSGSTKCDWQVVVNGEKLLYTNTKGINPFFHDEDAIEAFIRENRELVALAAGAAEVFFYCAGGSLDHLNEKVARGLARIFTGAEIRVDHDLTGAAYATWDGSPAITCILGTGSNSVYYDGHTMFEKVPALAYILGDEGSGSYYGKKLLTDYLYHELPPELDHALRYDMKLTKQEIMENVYMKPYANVYLAGFMKFIHKYLHTDYVRNMIAEGMETFMRRHVMCFENYREVSVHFIGSVAFFFSKQLHEQAAKLGIGAGKILKKPIDGLVAYHLKYHLDKENR